MATDSTFPVELTEDRLFGLIEGSMDVRCLSCETVVHVTDKDYDEEGNTYTTLYCASCEVEDVHVH